MLCNNFGPNGIVFGVPGGGCPWRGRQVSTLFDGKCTNRASIFFKRDGVANYGTITLPGPELLRDRPCMTCQTDCKSNVTRGRASRRDNERKRFPYRVSEPTLMLRDSPRRGMAQPPHVILPQKKCGWKPLPHLLSFHLPVALSCECTTI